MANEGMPINTELIAWARKRAGLTQDEAAQKFAHIAAWGGERTMSKPAKINWIRWKDVCQSLLMAGAMKDFSRSECRRVATLLRNGVAAGTVLHKKEGSKSYWAIEPSKFAEATKS